MSDNFLLGLQIGYFAGMITFGVIFWLYGEVKDRMGGWYG